MAFGPVEVLVLAFPGNQFRGEIIPELQRLAQMQAELDALKARQAPPAAPAAPAPAPASGAPGRTSSWRSSSSSPT